jgi:uncharacterized protein (DUF302 family)
MDSGLVTRPSPFPHAATLVRLADAITARGLTIFATIDHAQAAGAVGLEMNAATLLIFGSPKGGTPLMRLAPTLAIDLPLKALVWADDTGATWLTYNAPAWMARRHGLGASSPLAGGVVDDPAHRGPDLATSGDADLEFGPEADPAIRGIVRALAEIAQAALFDAAP